MSVVPPNEPIVIGTIGAPYGVKGWVKVHSNMEPEDNILAFKDWYIQAKDGSWHVYHVVAMKRHGDSFVACFDGISDRDVAAMLTNKRVVISRHVLPKLDSDQYYWSDLVGLNVITDSGMQLGKVEYLFETGANDVIVVQGDKERLIPYVPGDYILEIDLTRKIMIVNWDPEF